jgi:hypothetical protein
MSKNIMSMFFYFSLHLSRFFRSRWVWNFRVRLIFSSLNVYLIFSSLYVAFCPEVFIKLYAHSLSKPLWNCIRTDTRLQIKERKNQHIHPAAWNYVHWLQSYKVNSKVIPVIDRGGLQSGEMLRIPHCLDNIFLCILLFLNLPKILKESI